MRHPTRFTAEMLASFQNLRDFDALSRDPFVVFLEPPQSTAASSTSWRCSP